MLNATQGYKAAIIGDSRHILLRAVVEIIDPDIEYGAVGVNGSEPFSNIGQLTDKEMDSADAYITLERNRWILGGGFKSVPDDYVVEGQVGVVSGSLADADGAFESARWVELSFTGVSILQACSVAFPTAWTDGVAEEFTVSIYQGGVLQHEHAITSNRESRVDLSGFTVYDPDKIRVTVTKWSLPFRRSRLLEIIPGLYERWGNDELAAFSVKGQGDVSCLSLPYGTCSLRMDNHDRRFEPRSKDGIFQSIEARQSIPVSIGVDLGDGAAEFKQVGVFYQHAGGWRTGDNGLSMQWELVDIVGLIANRTFIAPEELPRTLGGWMAAIVSQLGENFAERWHVDPAYIDLPLVCREEDIEGRSCGEILRWVCMATGTWPRADAETGNLTAEPLWHQGNELTLDNLESYPIMRANDAIAAIIFTLNDGENTKFVVSGNSGTSNKTVTVSNPFIKTKAEALTAARQILSAYGGNKLETVGRGDPSGEIGDVDTVWLDESSATTARRVYQTFTVQEGVLRGCQSTLLQADGSFLFQNRAVLTESGVWQAPSGVTSLRLIVVGRGEDGEDGEDGSWNEAGEDGEDGRGALVWAETVAINEGQTFKVSILDTGTTFGSYSSAKGKRYPYGYTDVASGDSFARSGVEKPLPGSGDGGKGGVGGAQGHSHFETKYENTILGNLPAGKQEVVDNYPGKGAPGAKGAAGCVVIYWEKGGDV